MHYNKLFFLLLYPCLVSIFPIFSSSGAFAASIPGSNCTVSTTNLATVVIGNIQKAPDVPGTLEFSCEWKKKLDKRYPKVAYCWHIHGADRDSSGNVIRYAEYQGGGLFPPKIGFNIYSQGVAVGDITDGNNIIGWATKVNDYKYSVKDPIQVHFEGNRGVTNLPKGKYKYDNPDTHVVMRRLKEDDELNTLNACGSSSGGIGGIGNEKGHTKLTITVDTYCQVSTTQDLKFPKQTTLNKAIKANAVVNADCSGGTSYKTSINNGANYANGSRHMVNTDPNNNETIAYEISPESWVGVGTGTPEGVNKVINGTVPAQTTPTAGSYRDTLVVSIEYYPK